MTRRYYSWPELVQLYRDADIVVAAVFPCPYAAGVTTLMEGLSCHRPVVATRSPGLANYFEPSDGLSVVEPFDSDGMRQAIVRLLERPNEAQDQADAAFSSPPRLRFRPGRRPPGGASPGPVIPTAGEMGWYSSNCSVLGAVRRSGTRRSPAGAIPQHGQIVRRAVDFEDHVICFKGAGQACPQDAVDFEVR